MKGKNFLKQQSDIDKQQILEAGKNQKYYSMLEQIENAPKPKQNFWKRNLKWIAGAASVAVSAVILVCVLVFYPFASTDTLPIYLEENFEISNSTFDEMDADMKEYDFNIDKSLYDISVDKTIDKVSGDTILYSIHMMHINTTIKFDFVAVCNPNYTYPSFEITDKFTDITLPQYFISYSDTKTATGGIIILNSKAKIQKDKEIIYITEYQEYVTDSSRSIVDVIQETFI